MALGVSDYTVYKQRHLGAVLNAHLRICSAILRRATWAHEEYHYFDLHAGPGRYTHNGLNLAGSPLIFLDNLKTMGVRCHAVFFEIDDSLRTELVRNIRPYLDLPGLSVSINGDHEQFLPCYFGPPQKRPKRIFGLVYADPTGKAPPFGLLSRMFRQKRFSTLDLLLYFSATNLKRQLKAPGCQFNSRLKEVLMVIDKRHWIVREPYGRHQWTFLIGTNWTDFPVFERLGFHRWDSDEGQRILDILNYTNEELDEGKGGHGRVGV